MHDVNGSAGRAGARPDVSESVPSIAFEREYVFETLSHPRRRIVCSLLADRAEWPLEELATEIAARELGADAEAGDAEAGDAEAGGHRLDAVRVSLLHQHLPVLAQRAVVEYDEGSGVVRPGPRATVVQSVLAGIAAVLGTPAVRRAEDSDEGPREV